MKKKLLSRRGAGIELAILMMVVSFSMSILLTGVALIQSTKKVRAEERLQQSIALEQLGQDFLSAILKGDVENWQQGKYDGFEIVHQHIWNDGEVTKAATCKETGTMLYTCACGETQEKEIQLADHTLNKSSGTVKDEATCETDGKMICKCEICKEDIEVVIPAKGHSWEDVVETETETEPGTEHETEPDATGEPENETDVAELTEEQGCTKKTKQKCSVCGIVNKDNHTWGEGWEKVSATCKETGTMRYTCACGATKEEEIPVTDHDWGESAENDICQVCGKSRPTGIYTLTVYKTTGNMLNVRVTVLRSSGEETDNPETIEGNVVLKIVIHCDELTNIYKITEWTKNDRS